jgi:hypothetical protein
MGRIFAKIEKETSRWSDTSLSHCASSATHLGRLAGEIGSTASMKQLTSRERRGLARAALAAAIALVVALVVATSGGQVHAQLPTSAASADQNGAELRAIAKTLGERPGAEVVLPLLPPLAAAVREESTAAEALPLLEQALEQLLPDAVATHVWPDVARALKIAARARYAEANPAAAKQQLQALLALYRDVAQARRLDVDGPWRWLRQLHEVAAEYLRGDQTAEALEVLAEAADLNLPYRAELDDGRAALAGALNRRIAALDALERYDLLHDWTMPSGARRSLRVFSSLAPTEAPPAAFARALGERPNAASFPISQIGEANGLFSTAWTLVAAAVETGRLRRLTAELTETAKSKAPNAGFVLLLARIAAADRSQLEAIEQDLSIFDRPPSLPAQESLATIAGAAPDPLARFVVAAACTSNENTTPLGEVRLRSLVGAGAKDSPRLGPLAHRAWAAAVLKPVADARRLDDPNLELWIPAGRESAADAEQGSWAGAWFAHEEHFFRLGGSRRDDLCFRYPLAGDFEFRVEVQDGPAASGGLAFGGFAMQASGRDLSAQIGNMNLGGERRKPFPFVRSERWPTYQRLALRSTGDVLRFSCNGHPVESGLPFAAASPWLTLSSAANSTTAFRGLTLIGQPVIPRRVRLSGGDSLAGWLAGYYPGSVATPAEIAGDSKAARAPASEFDWYAADGVIHGAHRQSGASLEAPSRLACFRPLLNGESLDYEFFYEPGRVLVHPALGRLVFMLESGGVKLHWMTTGDDEWTGLDGTSAIVEPLNRRGPKRLPLKSGEWNRATIALANNEATLSLNGVVVYVRKLELENPRTFSFYYDRRQTAARIRNVVLEGDWPERLSAEQLAKLTAPRDAERAEAARAALGEIFAERHVADSALYVHRLAAAMSLEERYAYLSAWVLPGVDHAGLRMALDYTPTHPAPPAADDHPLDARRLALASQSSQSRVQTGGNLVAPALDLVEAARQLGRLDDVRRRVEQAPQADDFSRRARLAMLAIVDLARQEPPSALDSLDQLLALVEAGSHTEFSERWPETLATHAALLDPATRNAARDLAHFLLVKQLRSGPDSGSEAWRRQMAALVGLAKHFEADAGDGAVERFTAEPRQSQWRPASHTTAQTRGLGFPPHCWQFAEARADHLVSHHQDYLYFQSPLRGDFEAEYDVPGFFWRDTNLVFRGRWVSPIYDHKSYALGTYRGEEPRRPIDPPLTKVAATIHARTAVVDSAIQTYANGRLLHEQRAPELGDPWVAIRNIERFAGGAENVRIAGRPQVPEAIGLIDDAGLNNWFAYYEEQPGSPEAWRFQSVLPGDLRIVGGRQAGWAGYFAESLFRYHRPMFEDGVIEYEFFRREGEFGCHPALDRLVLLLEPTGVRMHWITDGAYDRTSLAADNVFDEPDCRRGPERLPLKDDAWNQLALELKGDLLRLRLNGQLVYERKLEPTNQRTFGLFHYADQTQALARKIIWRGDWPRELPPESEQQLAGEYGDFLEARRAELTATFEHDFVRDGLPFDKFAISQGQVDDFSPRSDGLHVVLEGKPGYRNAVLAPRLTVGGDFDATISYERFQGAPQEKGSASLMLTAKFDDPPEHEGSVHRRALFRSGGMIDQIFQAALSRREAGEPRYDFSRGDPFEASAGRLRIARRGDKVFYLIAENDSPHFRLVRSETVTSSDLTSDGLRFTAQIKEPGRVEAVWKSLSIRAERLSGLAVENAAQLSAELDRRRQALPARFVHDFTRDELTIERFHRWGGEPAAAPQPGGLHLVAHGADNWISMGVSPHCTIGGDFDIAVEIDGAKLDAPKPGQSSAIMLQIELPNETRSQYSVIWNLNDAGRRQAFAQQRLIGPDGASVYAAERQECPEPLRRMRLVRRGAQLYLLGSTDLAQSDRLLGRFEDSQADLFDTAVRVMVHAGGEGRTAEARIKKLDIRGAKIETGRPALPAPKG